MKIAKKFMTLALAAALGVGCATVGVGAAPSNTSDVTVSSEKSPIYEVVKEIEKTESFKDLQAKYPDLADAFTAINNSEMEINRFIEVLKSLPVDEADKADLEDAIAKLEGKEIVTGVYEFDVLKHEEAKPNDDGTYEVTIQVPSITDTMEGIQLFVYSKDGTKKMVVIDPSKIDKKNNGNRRREIINNSESERSRQRWRLFLQK